MSTLFQHTGNTISVNLLKETRKCLDIGDCFINADPKSRRRQGRVLVWVTLIRNNRNTHSWPLKWSRDKGANSGSFIADSLFPCRSRSVRILFAIIRTSSRTFAIIRAIFTPRGGLIQAVSGSPVSAVPLKRKISNNKRVDENIMKSRLILAQRLRFRIHYAYRMTRHLFLVLALLFMSTPWIKAAESRPPVRFAIVGLSHDHARGFIPGARKHADIQLAGIVEADQELAARYAQNYKLDRSLFHTSLAELLAKTNIQAVAAFTSTFDHKRVVEECAPHGLTVMMEKPLAVNMEHAKAIQAAAQKSGIQVLVNYETTWYPSNQEAYSIVHDQNALGNIRKMVVHDGHRGPKEIGCSQDFLQWLTDPVLNGGGALTDFGCYGANLMTWLMKGQRPTSVFAATQQIKPAIYPKVDDEATIVLTYPEAQGIIQASWNWPYDRKDMEIYGQTGQLLVPRRDVLKLRSGNAAETEKTPSPLRGSQADPLSYLAAVVRKEIKPEGLSSLEVNMIVTEILDAARKSAQTGQRIDL